MKKESYNFSASSNYQNQMVALRKANIINNLPVTSRVLRLRKQQELMDLLVNHYVFNSDMKKTQEEELSAFLSYTEDLYATPSLVTEFIKNQDPIGSMPYLLSVLRHETHSVTQKLN